MLRIEEGAPFKGFLCRGGFESSSSLIVVTGKNGVGKTRLFESIKSLSAVSFLDGEILCADDVVYLGYSSLVPAFSSGYSDDGYISRRSQTVSYFSRNKEEFVEPYNVEKSRMLGMVKGIAPLSYEELYKLCQSISLRLGLPVKELEPEHINLFFEEPAGAIYASKNLTSFFNGYLRRRADNECNIWRNERYGKNIPVVSEDFFANRPWDVLNRLVDKVFEGKFLFNVPDEEAGTFDYVAELIERETSRVVTVDDLSSGEKTLLWLVMTLFNTQCADPITAAVPKLLLLDEPDAFLHPKMVSMMYGVLSSFAKEYKTTIMIISHSPTTIALAPEDCIYILSDGQLKAAEKDAAISSLLDGISQVAISPENRRQVFVESYYDAEIYGMIYNYLRAGSEIESSKVSLSFVWSGEQMPIARVTDTLKSVLDIVDAEVIERFLMSLNGVGSCSHVYGAVERLVNAKNKHVRGLVDWDKKNKPSSEVAVLGEGYSYTIENLALDPLSILLMLHMDKGDRYSIKDICGVDVEWWDWLERKDLLQCSLDNFIAKVLGRANRGDVPIRYVSGVELNSDSDYLLCDGKLEGLVLKAYKELNEYIKQGREKDLKYTVVSKSMLKMSRGKFIPEKFALAFSELQKS